MKKALVIVAMLLLVTPVMATPTTTISAVQGTQFPDACGNPVQPVSITYSTTVDIRAFALDINIDGGGPNFKRIYNFKTGESNGAVPGGTSGYGIFPSKFSSFINPAGPNWVDPNYDPTPAWQQPGTTGPDGNVNSGIGFPQMIVEMGALYVGDANKPASSGTLFTFDVNSYGVHGTFCITIKPDVIRGGVVNIDGNDISKTSGQVAFNGTCINFPCTVPNVVNAPEASATDAITASGFTLGNRTTTCSNTIAAGRVISTNPAAGLATCGISVAYVVSSGVCVCTVPNVVGQPEATATANITAAGFTTGTRTTTCSPTIAAGNVISTNPAAGNTPACGSAVAYVVSTGPCVCTVPNVVGLFEAPIMTAGPNAVGQIIAAGFTTARTTTTSATVAAGKIISTAPASGATPGCGTAVTMTVSTGKGTCATCKGDMVADSILQVSDMSSLKSALVAAFNRTGSYKVDKGSAVTGDKWNICGDLVADNALQVSDMSSLKAKLVAGFNAGGSYKAPFVPINNPVKTQAAMTTAITNSFLVVGTVTTAHSATVPSGSVISTNPAYPTYRNCNTTVDMVVSAGP